jgi:NAD+ kinase
MKKIGIIGLNGSSPNRKIVISLIEILKNRNIEFAIYRDLFEGIDFPDLGDCFVGVFSDQEDFMDHHFDFAITLGGDGTILRAVTIIGTSGVPVLGVNLGRLGFLASLDKNNLESAIDNLIQGKYTTEERSMLYLESNHPLFSGSPFALNDFTLHKRDTSSMVAIDTYINDVFLNTYWADGIIVATPTGSTGYSLSCGGPIIFPGSNNFVVTPVAPHNLNVRPIVISDHSIVSFVIRGRTNNFLCSLDSRYEKIDHGYKLAVRKFDHTTRLIHMPDYSYMANIRQKLAWGIDKRN